MSVSGIMALTENRQNVQNVMATAIQVNPGSGQIHSVFLFRTQQA